MSKLLIVDDEVAILEALTDILFCYHVTTEFEPRDPDEHTVPWNDPRVASLWSTTTPILSARDAAVES